MTEPYQVLEREWAAWNDLDPEGMVACSSGTAALHLALEAMWLSPGSRVIVPDYTYLACARAVSLAGLVPVFVGCNKDNLLLDDSSEGPDSLGWISTDPYSVLMTVHIYGRRCDMDWLHSTCGDNHAIIEDISQAHGLRPHPSTDAATWSFHRSKIVHGEEGGAVWFRDLEHAERARVLRNCGQIGGYRHMPRGHNYRLANLLATPILQSLRLYQSQGIVLPNGERHGSLMDARRQLEATYEAQCPQEWRMPKREVPWVYDLRIPGMVLQKQHEIVSRLNGIGVAARMGFCPMRRQAEYRGLGQITITEADLASEEVFTLPITPGTTSPELIGRAFRLIGDCID